MSQRFVLSISPSYVSHWGVWEAVREILQNAYDQKTKDSSCGVDVKYIEGMESLHIGTTKGELSKASLILGNTDKSDDKRLRGKFGEGYKLALLVLARLGIKVFIKNRDEIWTAAIEHDHDFDSEVLVVYVYKQSETVEGVEFQINPIREVQFENIRKNMYHLEGNHILDNAEQKGRIYVGGLYVSTNKEAKKGYAFSPETIRLDRDRGMVEDFNLFYETSRLWGENLTRSEETVDLMMDRAPDVHYMEFHATDKIITNLQQHFENTYGEDAIAVATQQQTEECISAGKKWVLVPDVVRVLLSKVKNFFIPKSGTIVERLEKFLLDYCHSEESRTELQDIIRLLRNQREYHA